MNTVVIGFYSIILVVEHCLRLQILHQYLNLLQLKQKISSRAFQITTLQMNQTLFRTKIVTKDG
jgi:hypothetical protein